MADRALKPSEMAVITSLPNNALFVVSTDVGTVNVDSKAITAQSIFNDVQANAVTAQSMFINYNTTPTSNSDNVGGRRIWWDSSYLYVAVSNTDIRRVPLQTFT